MNRQAGWRTLVLALLACLGLPMHSVMADGGKGNDAVSEAIWALEGAYFANLYKADYDGVLVLVHKQFLGWPGVLPQPIDRKASERFMKQLIGKPTSCTVKIERAGIRVLAATALTQYTLHVTCADSDGARKAQSSRITHTWVREGASWKLLGGMSYDQ